MAGGWTPPTPPRCCTKQLDPNSGAPHCSRRARVTQKPSELYIYICMYVSYATSMYILHRHTIKQAMSLSRDPHGYSYGDPYIYIYIRIYET